MSAASEIHSPDETSKWIKTILTLRCEFELTIENENSMYIYHTIPAKTVIGLCI